MERKLQTAAIEDILCHEGKMYKIKILLNMYRKYTHSGGYFFIIKLGTPRFRPLVRPHLEGQEDTTTYYFTSP